MDFNELDEKRRILFLYSEGAGDAEICKALNISKEDFDERSKNDIIGGIDADENTKIELGLAPFSGNVDYDRIRISCNAEGSYVDGEDTITVYYATIASVVMCPMPVGLR